MRYDAPGCCAAEGLRFPIDVTPRRAALDPDDRAAPIHGDSAHLRNDAGWGLERELQGGTDTVGCELTATRYDKVMEGFGGAGET